MLIIDKNGLSTPPMNVPKLFARFVSMNLEPNILNVGFSATAKVNSREMKIAVYASLFNCFSLKSGNYN